MPRRAAAYVREEPEGLSSKELNTDTLEGEQHLPHAPLAAHHHQAVVVHYVTVLRHGELPVGERGFVRLGRPQQRSGPAARRLAARRPVPHLLQPRGRSRRVVGSAAGRPPATAPGGCGFSSAVPCAWVKSSAGGDAKPRTSISDRRRPRARLCHEAESWPGRSGHPSSTSATGPTTRRGRLDSSRSPRAING